MSKRISLSKEFVPGFSESVKPTVPVEIDWSNLLTKGLKHFFIFQNGIAVDLVSKIVGNNIDVVQVGADPYFDSVDARYDFPNNDFSLDAEKAFTVAFKADFNITGPQHILVPAVSSSPTWSHTLYAYNNAAYRPMVFSFKKSTGALLRTVLFPAATFGDSPVGDHFWGITNNGIDNAAGDFTCYKDNLSAAGTSSAITARSTCSIGGADQSFSVDGTIEYVAVWQEELAPAQVENFRNDPYALLKPTVDLSVLLKPNHFKRQHLLPKEFVPGFHRDRPPAIQVRIDWSHPLADGLIFFAAVIDGVFQNLAAEKYHDLAHLPTGNIDIEADKYIGSSATMAVFNIGDVAAPPALTVASRSTLYAENNSFSYIYGGDNYTWIWAYANDTNTWQINYNASGWARSISTIPLNVPTSIMMASPTNQPYVHGSWFINGVKEGSSTGDSETVRSLSTSLNVGNRSSGSRWFEGEIEYVAIWDRGLNDSEATSFQEMPYQILKPSLNTAYYSAEFIKRQLALPKEFVPGFSESVKPTIPVEIDYAHNLASNIYSATYFFDNLTYDLVDPAGWTNYSTSFDYKGGEKGVRFATSVSTSIYLLKSNLYALSVAATGSSAYNNKSVAFGFNSDDVDPIDENGIFCHGRYSYEYGLFIYVRGNELRIFNGVIGAATLLTYTIENHKTYNCLVTFDSGNLVLYVNGKKVAEVSGHSTTNPVSASYTGQLGRITDGTYGDSFRGIITYITFFGKKLSESEALQWTENPYQILKPAQEPIVPLAYQEVEEVTPPDFSGIIPIIMHHLRQMRGQ